MNPVYVGETMRTYVERKPWYDSTKWFKLQFYLIHALQNKVIPQNVYNVLDRAFLNKSKDQIPLQDTLKVLK